MTQFRCNPWRAFWIAVLFVGVSWTSSAVADDWQQWRGPDRDGVWKETGILTEIPAGGLKVRWRMKIAGGYAGPAVADSRVFVTDLRIGDSQMERVLCFDEASGKSLWVHEYPCDYRKMEYGAGPRATPTVAAGKVYTLGSMGHLYCLDAENGNVVWQKDLVSEYSARVPRWGVSAAPLIDNDLLIVFVGGKPDASVVAFDRDTGEECWRALEDAPTYSAPIIEKVGDERQLIVWTSDNIFGLDPENGEVFWKAPHKTINSDGLQGIASPVRRDNLLLCLGAFSGRSQMLRLDGNHPEVSVVWSRRKKPSTMIGTPYFPDVDYFYTTLLDGRLACLDAKSGEEVWATEEATGERGAGMGNTAHLTPNGDRVFLFNQKGQLILSKLSPEGYEEFGRCWILEPTNSYRAQRPFTWAHPAYANRCIFVRNDRDLICVSLASGDVPELEADSGQTEIARLLPGFAGAGPTDVLAFSPDGKKLATSYYGTIKLFDRASAKALPAPKKHRWRVGTLKFSPDGNLLVSAGGTEWRDGDGTPKSDNAEVVVWDSVTNTERARLKDLHKDKVMTAVFSPDGKTLATGSADQSIKLLDLGTLKVRAVLEGHGDAVGALAFSPDSKTLASAGWDRTVRLWDPVAATEIATLEGHPDEIRTLAFSPDGKTLATGCTDWNVRLWDVTARKEKAVLSGHRGAIYGVAFSPDGKMLASGSGDQTIKLWDVALAKELTTLRGHESRITSLSFSPDGTTLASCADDEKFNLWEINR